MPDKNLEKQIHKSLLKIIENSEGSTIFNSFYVKDIKKNEVYDVLSDGEYSCAFYVGGILSIVDLIDRPHAIVTTTLEKMLEHGFEEVTIDNLKPGDVVRWEDIHFDSGEIWEHIGFYFDDNTAYSTSLKERKVKKHHPTFNDERKIIKAYRNKNI